MLRRDPVNVVLLGACGGGGRVYLVGGGRVGGVGALLARGALRAGGAVGAALLREERGNPGVVDEVAGASEGGGEDEIEEDTAAVGKAASAAWLGDSCEGKTWGLEGKTYICGSKMLVGASTTATVPLYAWMV